MAFPRSTTASPLLGVAVLLPRSATTSPAIVVSRPDDEGSVGEESYLQEGDTPSMDVTDVHISTLQTSQPGEEEERSQEPPSNCGTHFSLGQRPNLPYRSVFVTSSSQARDDETDEAAGDGEEPLTPHTHHRSFLLSMINSTTRPHRTHVPHRAPPSDINTADTPVPTPRGLRDTRGSRALRRSVLGRHSSQPVAQTYISSPTTSDSEFAVSTGGTGCGVGHHPFAARRRVDHLDGVVARFNDVSLLRERVVRRCDGLWAEEGGGWRVNVGGTALGNVEEDAAEGWLEGKAELEEMVEALSYTGFGVRLQVRLSRESGPREVESEVVEAREERDAGRHEACGEDGACARAGRSLGVLADLRNANSQIKRLEEELMHSGAQVDDLEKEAREKREFTKTTRRLRELHSSSASATSPLTKTYVSEFEQVAEVAIARVETLVYQAATGQAEIECLRAAERQVESLEEARERAEELARQMKEALEAAEEKILADKGEIIEAPEEELDKANKEIIRLTTLLNQSPARKVVEMAKDAPRATGEFLAPSHTALDESLNPRKRKHFVEKRSTLQLEMMVPIHLLRIPGTDDATQFSGRESEGGIPNYADRHLEGLSTGTAEPTYTRLPSILPFPGSTHSHGNTRGPSSLPSGLDTDRRGKDKPPCRYLHYEAHWDGGDGDWAHSGNLRGRNAPKRRRHKLSAGMGPAGKEMKVVCPPMDQLRPAAVRLLSARKFFLILADPDVIEKEQEDLLERSKALQTSVKEIGTPTKGFKMSGISPIHRVERYDCRGTVSPLLAEINRSQRELDRANESFDDKQYKLEDAGLGVVGLTKRLEDARVKIVGLEEEIAQLSRTEQRACEMCLTQLDLRSAIRAEADKSSVNAFNSSLRPEPPTPPTWTSEALQTELHSANSHLVKMNQRCEKEKQKLLGDEAVLQDAANRLYVKVRTAEEEVRIVAETRKAGEKLSVGVEGLELNNERALKLRRQWSQNSFSAKL
ncbi:hypothetical protein B0H11DRAFT_2400783 [Mycena galericulata]|nr:hypothetical protein B0H11DRAFT_2400783 [Mycena galericulata]